MTEVLVPSPLSLNRGANWYNQLKCGLNRVEVRLSMLHPNGVNRSTDMCKPQSPIIHSLPEQLECGRGQKRKLTLESPDTPKRFGILRGHGDNEKQEILYNFPPDIASPLPWQTRLLSEQLSTSPIMTQGQEIEKAKHPDELDLDLLPRTRNFFRKKWQTDIMTASEVLRKSRKLRSIVFKRAQKGIDASDFLMHRTEHMYFVKMDKEPIDVVEDSPVKAEVEAELKVPSWRINHIPTGYQLEGTENLDDEIFLKRHQRPEQDEKRRKRWDIQRMRDQNRYGKVDDRTLKAKKNRLNNGEPCTSFLPDPDGVKFIELSNQIPVSAFGYPIPVLDNIEFQLPWSKEVKGKSHKKKVGRPKKKL